MTSIILIIGQHASAIIVAAVMMFASPVIYFTVAEEEAF